jgi:hypothetical protein
MTLTIVVTALAVVTAAAVPAKIAARTFVDELWQPLPPLRLAGYS